LNWSGAVFANGSSCREVRRLRHLVIRRVRREAKHFSERVRGLAQIWFRKNLQPSITVALHNRFGDKTAPRTAFSASQSWFAHRECSKRCPNPIQTMNEVKPKQQNDKHSFQNDRVSTDSFPDQPIMSSRKSPFPSTRLPFSPRCGRFALATTVTAREHSQNTNGGQSHRGLKKNTEDRLT
jgi:hypothetical protein